MTKNKQFKAIGENIWKGNEVWCVAGGEHCADVIATALNMQVETIQDLSTKKEDAEYELLHLKEKYEELLEKNRQLTIDLTQAHCDIIHLLRGEEIENKSS